ncbi:putative membrane protein [Actinoplanes tereljensis]
MVLGALFLKSGLDASDKWASVFGVFLNVAGVAISVYSIIVARRSPSTPHATAAADDGGRVINHVEGTNMNGPVVQSRDIHGGLSIHHQSAPKPPQPHGDARSSQDP